MDPDATEPRLLCSAEHSIRDHVENPDGFKGQAEGNCMLNCSLMELFMMVALHPLDPDVGILGNRRCVLG